MSDVTIKSYVPQAIAAVNAGTETGAIAMGMKVVAQAKALAPVAMKNGGLLKGSIMMNPSSGSKYGYEKGDILKEEAPKIGAVVGTAVEYGTYQEYGTRKMEAQPFLRPAVDIVTSGTSGEKAMADAMYNSVRKKLERLSASFTG